MEIQAIIFMIIGLCITWGGLAYSLYVQMKDANKNNSYLK